MSSKLQQRLSQKTAAIERSPDSIATNGNATEGAAPEQVMGVQRSMTMPGQLGAFRLEAQKYKDIITDLQAQLLTASAGAGDIRRIQLDLIDDSPYQPRMVIDEEEIDDLAKTMAAARQADPIKVRPAGVRYELISGHRRTRAARSLGWEAIDAIIEHRTDAEAEVEAMLLVVGNVSLSDYELAKMYDRAITRGICPTQTACGTFFATRQPQVSARLDMLNLPTEIVNMLEAKPRLFGYECSKVIKALIKDHPGEISVIVRGVERLGEGMKQNSLKGWVLQAIKQDQVSTQDARKTITRNGRPVFTTKRDPRSVTIACKNPGMDVAKFEERLRAWLQEQANDLTDSLIDTDKN